MRITAPRALQLGRKRIGFLETVTKNYSPGVSAFTTKMQASDGDAAPPPDYKSWTNEQFIRRVTELEQRLKAQLTLDQNHSPKKILKKPRAPFDPSRYSTRFIALKFAYLGQRYNGYEHHLNNTTPLTTIEEELWQALMKCKLIFPTPRPNGKIGEVNWDGCEYSKCGRTDKGVSAFGQVVGIRVRSSRPLPKKSSTEEAAVTEAEEIDLDSTDTLVSDPYCDPVKDELPYIQLLNRVLPPDIRILAWCPNPPPGFSARFSCRERRYRYFFTQPAFAPVPGYSITRSDGRKLPEGWLDIEAMREAAKLLEGTHDFRNLCKIDPSKQITNFERKIFRADIEEVKPADGPVGFVGRSPFAQSQNGESHIPGGPPRVYSFVCHGSAFLWHQIRHLVAVLFLVGQGLEQPSIVSELLDIQRNPTRPKYEMAVDAPLVLWDCIFPSEGGDPHKDTLHWIYAGEEPAAGKSAKHLYVGDRMYGRGGIMDELWEVWRERKIDELLAGSLLDVVASQGSQEVPPEKSSAGFLTRIFDGDNGPRAVGQYIPVLQKERLEPVEVINARYAARKGLTPRDAPTSAMDVDE